MPLTNFGSILNFAEKLETRDQDFYNDIAENPVCAGHRQMFMQFAADAKKNCQAILRTRRENITEMILEPIENFTRAPFDDDFPMADNFSTGDALTNALHRETRAEGYYREASNKLKALPEVARALKQIAKKRAAHKKKLEEVSSGS